MGKVKISDIAFWGTFILLAGAFFLLEYAVFNNGWSGIIGVGPHIGWGRVAVYVLILAAAVFFREKIKGYLEESECLKKYKITLFVIYFVICGIFAFYYLYENRLHNFSPKPVEIGAIVLLLIMGFLAIVYIGNKTETNVFAIGLPIVLVLPLFTKMNHGIDEFAHFSEAYNVSLGRFFHVEYNAVLPAILKKIPNNVVYENFLTNYQLHFNYHQLINLPYSPIGGRPAGYPTLFYLPAAVGDWIGRHLNFDIMSEMYMGRIVNCICFLFLVYLIVKIIPIGKNIMLVVLLSPYLSLLASTYSIDGVGTCCVFLFVALCLNYAYNERDLHVRDYILLIMSAAFAVAFKTGAYFLILLFILLIPAKRIIKSQKLRSALKVALPFLMLAVIAAVIAAAVYLYHKMPYGLGDIRGGKVDEKLQIKQIFTHPFYTIYIYLRWLENNLFNCGYLGEMVRGYFFGSASALSCPLLAFWIFTAATDYNLPLGGKRREYREKIIMLLYILITPIFIVFGLYLVFTPVGSADIAGVQLRYFYPVVAILLLLLNNKSVKNTIRNYSAKIAFCATIILTVAEYGMLTVR